MGEKASALRAARELIAWGDPEGAWDLLARRGGMTPESQPHLYEVTRKNADGYDADVLLAMIDKWIAVADRMAV